MTFEQLLSLVAYNRWANARLLQATEDLTVDERARDLRTSFVSLQGTLIHILWGERRWLQFWQDGTFIPEPALGEYPDFASLRKAWTHHEEGYAAYLIGLTQAELDAPRAVKASTYTLASWSSTSSTTPHIIAVRSRCFYGNSATSLRQPTTDGS